MERKRMVAAAAMAMVFVILLSANMNTVGVAAQGVNCWDNCNTACVGLPRMLSFLPFLLLIFFFLIFFISNFSARGVNSEQMYFCNFIEYLLQNGQFVFNTKNLLIFQRESTVAVIGSATLSADQMAKLTENWVESAKKY